MFKEIPVVIVAGMSKTDRVIGDKNQLLWHVPDDLKRFKALTLGHPVIMGRKTFESIVTILGKPLPGRTNIVVSRNTEYEVPEGVKIASSLTDALLLASSGAPTEIHIGGGAEMYNLSLPYTDRLHLTFYDDDKEGDTFFPDFQNDFTVCKKYPPQVHEGLTYQWIDYLRK